MLPSRGFRWSGQAIGIGRRRLETASYRHFSSSTSHYSPLRANPLVSSNRASIPKILPQLQISRSGPIVRNGASVRFASTTPAIPTSATPAANALPNALPTEAVGSAAAAPDWATALDSASEFSGEAVRNIPEHIGYLKELGFDFGYGPTSMMQWLMEHIHVLAGTPWWVSIALTAVAVRIILFKPYLDAADNAARLATIAEFTKPIQAKMNAALRTNDTNEHMKYRGELMTLQKRAGVKMWKSFVPGLQMITGYGTFFLLRAMAKLPVPGLETGGGLWFTNLTIPDPYYVLPATAAFVMYRVLKKGGEMGVSTLTPPMQKALQFGFPLMSFVFTFWLPSSIQLTFLVAGVISWGQASLLRMPKFRQFFGLIPLPAKAAPAASTIPRLRAIAAAPGPLSQAEVSSRFQSASIHTRNAASFDNQLNAIKDLKPPSRKASRTIIQGAVQDLKGTAGEAKNTMKEFIGSSQEKMDERRAKAELKQRQAYEKRRSEEAKSNLKARMREKRLVKKYERGE